MASLAVDYTIEETDGDVFLKVWVSESTDIPQEVFVAREFYKVARDENLATAQYMSTATYSDMQHIPPTTPDEDKYFRTGSIYKQMRSVEAAETLLNDIQTAITSLKLSYEEAINPTDETDSFIVDGGTLQFDFLELTSGDIICDVSFDGDLSFVVNGVELDPDSYEKDFIRVIPPGNLAAGEYVTNDIRLYLSSREEYRTVRDLIQQDMDKRYTDWDLDLTGTLNA